MITNKDFIKEQVDFGRTAIENLQVWDVDRNKYMNASEADSCGMTSVIRQRMLSTGATQGVALMAKSI